MALILKEGTSAFIDQGFQLVAKHRFLYTCNVHVLKEFEYPSDIEQKSYRCSVVLKDVPLCIMCLVVSKYVTALRKCPMVSK